MQPAAVNNTTTFDHGGPGRECHAASFDTFSGGLPVSNVASFLKPRLGPGDCVAMALPQLLLGSLSSPMRKKGSLTPLHLRAHPEVGIRRLPLLISENPISQDNDRFSMPNGDWRPICRPIMARAWRVLIPNYPNIGRRKWGVSSRVSLASRFRRLVFPALFYF